MTLAQPLGRTRSDSVRACRPRYWRATGHAPPCSRESSPKRAFAAPAAPLPSRGRRPAAAASPRNRRSIEIRVSEPDGTLAFHSGGPSEGSGEFGDLCCLLFARDGEFWVRESARYSAFVLGSAGAEYQRILRTPRASERRFALRRPLGHSGLMDLFAFDLEGNLFSVGPVRGDDDFGVGLKERLRVPADGTADTLGVERAARVRFERR